MTRREMYVKLSDNHVALCQAYSAIVMEERKTFETPGARVVDKSTTPDAVQLMGYMGEMAVCLLTEWQPNWHFVSKYDEGKDFIVNDIIMQVKTGRTQLARNLMFKTTNDFKMYVDAAIYVQYAGDYPDDPARDPSFVICGWIPRLEFMKNHKTRDFGRGVGPQPCMDKDDLLDIFDLIDLVRQKGEL